MNTDTKLSCELKPFTQDDWCLFQGAEGDNPLIGELKVNDHNCAIILDDNQIGIYPENEDEAGYQFAMFFCEDSTYKGRKLIAEGLVGDTVKMSYLKKIGFEVVA